MAGLEETPGRDLSGTGQLTERQRGQDLDPGLLTPKSGLHSLGKQ